MTRTGPGNLPFSRPTALGGNPVSWQGVNDLSAHPASSGAAVQQQLGHPEHPGRPDQPREPVRLSAVLQRLPGRRRSGRRRRWPQPTTSTATTCPTTIHRSIPRRSILRGPAVAGQLIFEPGYRVARQPDALGSYGFPVRLPRGLLQAPDPAKLRLRLDPLAGPRGPDQRQRRPVSTRGQALAYLQNINHNPLDIGDNLPDPR